MRGYSSSAETIPDGDPGIDRTLRTMQRHIDRGSGSPEVIRLAQGIAKSVPSRDEDAQASVLLQWVRGHTHYVHDPVGKELVKDPAYMLRELAETGKIASDCDDQVVLLAALLRAIGIEAEPVVVSGDSSTYSHVLLRYRSPKLGWTTLDPITKNAAGWFPSGAVRVGVYANGRINPSTPLTVQGLGAYDPPMMAASSRLEPGTFLAPVTTAARRVSSAVEPYVPLITAAWGILSIIALRKLFRGDKRGEGAL